MNYYIVSFDRRVNGQYRNFHDAFVAHAGIRRWAHHIKSSYIIGGDLTASEISKHFRATAKKHGLPTRHIVLRVDLSDRSGWASSSLWEWIRKQLER